MPLYVSVRSGVVVAWQRRKGREAREALLYVSAEVNHSTYSNAVGVVSNLKREQT